MTPPPTPDPQPPGPDLDAAGKSLAKALHLKRDTEHRDRWQTEWGTKTNTGLYLTLREMVKRIEAGEPTPSR